MIVKKKQDFKRTLVRKNNCVMIRGTFRTFSNINNGAFVRKHSTDKKPLPTFAPPEMFEWVLDTPLMMAVARY